MHKCIFRRLLEGLSRSSGRRTTLLRLLPALQIKTSSCAIYKLETFFYRSVSQKRLLQQQRSEAFAQISTAAFIPLEVFKAKTNLQLFQRKIVVENAADILIAICLSLAVNNSQSSGATIGSQFDCRKKLEFVLIWSGFLLTHCAHSLVFE